MVDKSAGGGSDLFSPSSKSKKFTSQRHSIQPHRMNLTSPNKNNFRVVESGELRVVNKAAK